MTTRKQWQARGMKRPPPKACVDLPAMTMSQAMRACDALNAAMRDEFNRFVAKHYATPEPIDQEKFARDWAAAIKDVR